MRTLLVSLFMAAHLVLPSTSQAQLACGDIVERKVVSLTGDLDCTGQAVGAVTLVYSTLKLNGYTVRGGEGVKCAGSCRVLGPGTVENSTKSGIWSDGWFATRYTIAKVTIRNSALWGIMGWAGVANGQSQVVLRDSLVEGSVLSGVYADRKVTVLRSTVRGNGTGATGGVGVVAGDGRAIVSQSTIEANDGEGVSAQEGIRIISSTVTGNRRGGAVAGNLSCSTAAPVTALRSAIFSNADPGCGPGECVDILSCEPPKVVRTTCDTSRQMQGTDDWNVCALD